MSDKYKVMFQVCEDLKTGDVAYLDTENGKLLKVKPEQQKAFLIINGEQFAIDFDCAAEDIAKRITRLTNMLAKADKPAEPLIVKSGETWVVDTKNRGSALYCGISETEPDKKDPNWKRFNEIEFTPGIVKLWPICIFSNHPSIQEIIRQLVYYNASLEYPYIDSIGDSYKYSRLATAQELQQAHYGQ